MVRRALGPGLIAIPAAFLIGFLAGGSGAAWSAAIGIAIVVANFVASGLSLAWAAGISLAAVQAVALGGFILRLGVILGLMLALRLTGWFSTVAFGLAVVPGTLLLLIYEGILVMRGLGQVLVLPGDAAAERR